MQWDRTETKVIDGVEYILEWGSSMPVRFVDCKFIEDDQKDYQLEEEDA